MVEWADGVLAGEVERRTESAYEVLMQERRGVSSPALDIPSY